MFQAIKNFFQYDECPWGNRVVYLVEDYWYLIVGGIFIVILFIVGAILLFLGII